MKTVFDLDTLAPPSIPFAFWVFKDYTDFELKGYRVSMLGCNIPGSALFLKALGLLGGGGAS